MSRNHDPFVRGNRWIGHNGDRNRFNLALAPPWYLPLIDGFGKPCCGLRAEAVPCDVTHVRRVLCLQRMTCIFLVGLWKHALACGRMDGGVALKKHFVVWHCVDRLNCCSRSCLCPSRYLLSLWYCLVVGSFECASCGFMSELKCRNHLFHVRCNWSQNVAYVIVSLCGYVLITRVTTT